MQKPLVLYTVLDWGLGHATRSIPVIKFLLNENYDVAIAGEGRSLLFLKSEFPDCNFYDLHGISVRYPENGSMVKWVLSQLPEFIRQIRIEKKQIKSLVERLRPSLIISDHRYGAYHPDVYSVFIGHQLRIRAPFGTSLLFYIHTQLLKKFNHILVPDREENGLSGDLSHHSTVLDKLKPVFIGPLSRLENTLTVTDSHKYEVLVLLSGPEPQRTLFENSCLIQLRDYPGKVLIIRGMPESDTRDHKGNIKLVPGVSASLLKFHLLNSPVIICRPGYSTLMDLAACGRNAILVPTPGQTEQTYLAELHRDKGFVVLNQHKMNLKSALHTFRPEYKSPLRNHELKLKMREMLEQAGKQ
jgi:uncharacterized protein (TIGR00661 family)